MTTAPAQSPSPDRDYDVDDAIKGFTAEEISALSGRIAVPGVPPKSRKEAKAHLAEIQRLQQYERRLMAQEALDNRRRREEHTRAIEYWATVAIPDWENQRGSKETARLWASQGVAPEMRAKVWRLALGNPRHITPHMYEICLAKAKDRMAKHRGQPLPERENYDPAHFSPRMSKVESAAMIDVDLPRTFLISKVEPSTPLSVPQSPRSHSPMVEIDTSSPGGSQNGGDTDGDSFTGGASSAVPSRQTSHQLAPSQAPPPAAARAAAASAGEATTMSPLTRAANANPSSLASSALLISRFNNDELLMRLNLTLRAFVELRPDIGYVQGMSYLAAMLLMHFEQEEEAFVGLATMLTMGHFPYFYTVNHTGMSAHINVFDEVLSIGCPQMHRNFTIIGVNPQMYVIDWWMSLFSRSLPFDIAARCWDMYLLDPAYLYRISMCILIYFQRYLHDEAALDEVMSFLSRVQKSFMDENRFFAIVNDSATYGPDIETIHQIMERHLTGLQSVEAADDDL